MSSDDKLTIETPEQTVLEFPLAGIGSRSLALAIDTLLQIAALILIGVAAGLVAYAGFFPQMGKQWVYAILIFLVFLLQFGYFAFFETIWNGRTPGKRWTHLRVITDSGRPVGAQGAILRNVIRIVDALPTLYAVGIVTSLISPQNKRVGDYVAGTVVIHEKTLQGGRLMWDTPATHLLATTQYRAITSAELQLVETFLERRNSFQDDLRRSMAHQIAERLGRGSSAPPETLQDPEKFLEALAEHSRNIAHFR
jgi:uncharacterized RDD family membrane protein YckC